MTYAFISVSSNQMIHQTTATCVYPINAQKRYEFTYVYSFRAKKSSVHACINKAFVSTGIDRYRLTFAEIPFIEKILYFINY